MDSSHPRRHRSWFPAVIASVVLFLGSLFFAASASAAGPRDPGPPNQGKSDTAPAHATTAPGHHDHAGSQTAGQGHTRKHTTGGGSAVSLPRPNNFQAQSDPDGMANGGVDQPGGTGGVDTSDQDGNNGSGNDADCEDDNRGRGVPGHCKVHTNQGHQHSDDQTGDETTDVPGTTTDVPDTTTDVPVLGGSQLPVLTPALPGLTAAQVSAPGGDSSVVTRDDAVAGISLTDATASAAAARPSASILPNTGASAALLGLSVAGLAALAVGGGLLRRSRAHA